MEIVLLKTLVSVAETGSFSSAANALNCVQSNVTTRIRRLEEHFGQRVFRRGRAGARLTEFGERLYTSAVDLLNHCEAMERELLEAAGAGAPLKLGSMETTAAVRLPAVLKALKTACPGSQISLATGPTSDLLASIWDRKIDAAFVAGPVDESRFHAVKAFTEQLVVATNPNEPETGPLLAFRKGCSYRATAETWLKSCGKLDREIIEMGTLEGILGCVDAGLGFAVAPESAVLGYRHTNRLETKPLPAPFALVETYLVWRIDHRPVKSHLALVALLENAAP